MKQEPIAQNTIEIPTISQEETVPPKEEVKTLSYSLSEKESIESVTETIEENAITDISIIEEVKEEISTESVSISIPDESPSETKEENQEIFKIADTTKELFPNFHIANDLRIDEGLLDMQDTLTIDEGEKAVSSEKETILEGDKEIVSEAEIPFQKEETEEITAVVSIEETEDSQKTEEAPVTEIVSAESPAEEPSPISLSSAEYVAEVKTELSEQRRAGFRFFMHKKTKILAGVSFVLLSVSAMAFFSGSLFSIDMQKSGKSNIQETAILEPTNTVTAEVENIVENTEVVPVIATPSYEIGRDYSVTKNKKKNIQSKSSSGVLNDIPTVSETSDSETPLDGVSLPETTIDETTPPLPSDSSDL